MAATKRTAKKAAKKSAKRTAKKSAKAAAKAPTKKAAPKSGRPGTAGKADGDAAVRAFIAGVRPEHRPIVQKLDALIGELVPDVTRAIKWSTPMYGREAIGWFAAVASFKDHVGLNFFNGIELKPVPPEGESKSMRRVNIRSMDDLDEKQVRSWIKQASSIQGWAKVG